jgi:hypothetical protein
MHCALLHAKFQSVINYYLYDLYPCDEIPKNESKALHIFRNLFAISKERPVADSGIFKLESLGGDRHTNKRPEQKALVGSSTGVYLKSIEVYCALAFASEPISGAPPIVPCTWNGPFTSQGTTSLPLPAVTCPVGRTCISRSAVLRPRQRALMKNIAAVPHGRSSEEIPEVLAGVVYEAYRSHEQWT